MQNLKNFISNKKFVLFLILLLSILIVSGLIFYKKSDDNDSDSKNTLNNEITNNETKFDDKKDFKFVVFSDIHYKGKEDNKSSNFSEAVDFIKKQNPDLVFTTGDNVSSCDGEKECKKKIKNWKTCLGSLSSKLFISTGNHDVESEDKETFACWTESFNLPENGPEGYKELVYSFNYGNSHFVVLATNLKEHIVSDEQLSWLENDLKNNSQPNKFIFYHESAFPIKDKVDESLDAKSEQRDKLWRIIDNYNVSAVFSGHEHLHSRRLIDKNVFPEAKNKIYQFIVGDTNYLNGEHKAPKKLSDVSGLEYINEEKLLIVTEIKDEKVVVNLYSVEGELLNSFNLK